LLHEAKGTKGWSGAERTSGHLTAVFKTEKDVTGELGLGSSVLRMAGGQEAMGINWNKRCSD